MLVGKRIIDDLLTLGVVHHKRKREKHTLLIRWHEQFQLLMEYSFFHIGLAVANRRASLTQVCKHNIFLPVGCCNKEQNRDSFKYSLSKLEHYIE